MPLTVGVNRLGGSNFNGYTNRSVGVKDLRKRQKKARKLREKVKKNPDLAKISSESMRFRQIRW